MKIPVLITLCCCLASSAEAPKKLAIEQALLAQSEDGTPVPSDYEFQPGDSVFFSCRVSGFAKQGDEPPKMYLSYKVEARDPQGVLIVPEDSGKVAADLAPEDKEWRPVIRATLALPPLAATGRYDVKVKVRDELAKTETEISVPLRIHGRGVEASDSLIVRNFRFLRSEDDKDPLQVAAYRPGDTVWARFDMTGYKIGEKNRYDVEYGLKVLRPTGETTYELAKAANDKNETFYPQLHTPGVLSLALPKNLKAGRYTVVLTVRDNLGGQTFEMRPTFDVE
jgi:hypothetical protein